MHICLRFAEHLQQQDRKGNRIKYNKSKRLMSLVMGSVLDRKEKCSNWKNTKRNWRSWWNCKDSYWCWETNRAAKIGDYVQRTQYWFQEINSVRLLKWGHYSDMLVKIIQLQLEFVTALMYLLQACPSLTNVIMKRFYEWRSVEFELALDSPSCFRVIDLL